MSANHRLDVVKSAGLFAFSVLTSLVLGCRSVGLAKGLSVADVTDLPARLLNVVLLGVLTVQVAVASFSSMESLAVVVLFSRRLDNEVLVMT